MLRVSEHFERSDTGRQRRGNEDAYFARAPLFAVADGMGGAQAGEVASHLAVEVLEQGLPDAGGSVEERLRARVQEANARINELGRVDDERAGMGTTLTAAYVGEDELSIVHVGDSRMYRLRDGTFERLTDDHTLVEELVRSGKLTPQEADQHPQRSIITRALGPEAGVQPDTHTWPARDGDVYLICSDGLTSMVPETRVGELVQSASSLSSAGRALIDAANAAGGRDNITVVLFRLEDVGGGGAAVQDTSEHRAAAPATVAAQATAPVTATAPVARRAPRGPRPPAPAGRRRRRRPHVPGGLVASVVVLAMVLLGGYYASQTVYFVGASNDGFVAVYRGLPYDLPAGMSLYRVNYESGVPVDELPPAQKRTLTEHKLRSRNDAQDLVRQMETGKLTSP
ncbi:MAG: family protein phosphatase [Solirubrobacteraceae bacterium]|jgi:protein phosphatase|nr:family protein phosphatase [Solirubrobacteraceae bacterium]MEA2357879.1 family protein phosphatase [Solirubrobacteraceae bacterium]